MINSTYTADINGAVAYDPAISGSIVSGLAGQMDPTTEAYAASYELRTDALALQSDGIAEPTALQTRAMYQFGAGVGPDVATANDSRRSSG
jgi:acyl-CoA hydrolase